MKYQRLGHIGYARILRAIIDQPMTAMQAADALVVFPYTMRQILRGMHQAGLLRIVGWLRIPRNIPMPIFAFGQGPDAPQPLNVDGTASSHRSSRERVTVHPELLAFISVVEALQEGCHSRKQLVEETGIHYNLARRLMAAMHRMGLVYVADWQREEIGPYSAQFQFGLGMTDKRRPKALTKTMRVTAYRQRRRAREKQMQILTAIVRPAANDARAVAA